jgi:large exoprotein involved in heme utilization and adhesion
MERLTRKASRLIAMLLVCALMAVTAPKAEAKPLTLEKVHARIVKQGLGNWVGVELSNGTAIVGRITNIDQDSFGLQLYNDPEVTPVLYSDVVNLHTGLSRGAFIGITVAGFAGVAVMAAVGFSMVHKNAQAALPTQPAQPVFPY